MTRLERKSGTRSKYDYATYNRKTIYADIERLRTYGLKITQTRGAAFGYYVEKRDFDLAELKLMVDAVQASKFITKKKSEELTAIGDNRQIRFLYCEWTVNKTLVPRKDDKPYIVSPWALTWDDENYYMVGYDAEAGMIKHYRVDKMKNIRMTDNKREGSELFRSFDLAAFARKTFAMFGGEERELTLECENRLVGVVIDRFGQDIMIIPDGDEHFKANVTVAVSPHFFGWLAAVGTGIRIDWPEEVRNEYKEYLQGVLDALTGMP